MADHKSMAGDDAQLALPSVRTIDIHDVKDALTRGLDDFMAMPSHVIFLSIIYPVVGLIIARVASGYEMLPLVFPLAAGFALVGPFAAIGLYELSRRREQGLESTFKHAFDVLHSPSIGAIAALAIVLTVIFLIWLVTAQAIYDVIFGGATQVSVGGFIDQLFATTEGWLLIVVGTGVGFVFAVVVLTISVVSFPLLLDRKISAAAAVQVSARAVLANPKPMAVWGLIVAGGLLIGSIPFFIGLAVVMPVLGHATWHLYRKVVTH